MDINQVNMATGYGLQGFNSQQDCVTETPCGQGGNPNVEGPIKPIKGGKPIKVTESEIINIVRRILKEDSHYGGNKGDKSKTRPGKRDYEGTPEQMEKAKRLLGKPRTMAELVDSYKKLYNTQSNTEGMPTPEEVMSRAQEVVVGGPDDDPGPLGMIWWWLLGVIVATIIKDIVDPWESDIILKENIDLVGKSKSGINIYEFNYINKKYGNGRYRGVMAQEVPSASFVGPEGTLMVDYSKLDVQFEEIN